MRIVYPLSMNYLTCIYTEEGFIIEFFHHKEEAIAYAKEARVHIVVGKEGVVTQNGLPVRSLKRLYAKQTTLIPEQMVQ